MKNANLVAKAENAIDAPVEKVWDALVNPETIRQYMFGATVVSDWKPGSPIVWKGEWKGKPFEDKGTILQIEPSRRLQYTHFSPLLGLPDVPENHHQVTIELSSQAGRTHLALSQDNNATEEARQHSEQNWNTMLAKLKQLLEA